MEKNWTPEEWVAFQKDQYPFYASGKRVYTAKAFLFCDCHDDFHAQRTVACVNALADIPNPEGIGELVKAADSYERKTRGKSCHACGRYDPDFIGEKGHGEGCELVALRAALRACGIEVE